MVRFEQHQAVDRYREHLEEVFMDVHCYQSILHLAAALHSLLSALPLLPWQRNIAAESVKDVVRFAIVSVEVSVCSYAYLLHYQLTVQALLAYVDILLLPCIM